MRIRPWHSLFLVLTGCGGSAVTPASTTPSAVESPAPSSSSAPTAAQDTSAAPSDALAVGRTLEEAWKEFLAGRADAASFKPTLQKARAAQGSGGKSTFRFASTEGGIGVASSDAMFLSWKKGDSKPLVVLTYVGGAPRLLAGSNVAILAGGRTAEKDEHLVAVDVASGKVLANAIGRPENALVAPSKHLLLLALSEAGDPSEQIAQIDLASSTPQRALPKVALGKISSLSVSKNGAWLLLRGLTERGADKPDAVAVYDVSTGKPVTTVTSDDEGGMVSGAVGGDSLFFAVASSPPTLTAVDLTKEKTNTVVKAGKKSGRQTKLGCVPSLVRASADGKWVGVTGDGCTEILDARALRVVEHRTDKGPTLDAHPKLRDSNDADTGSKFEPNDALAKEFEATFCRVGDFVFPKASCP